MRSETQNNVDAINKSLKLLAQRMDWETAPHRLEEVDAMIEAPFAATSTLARAWKPSACSTGQSRRR